MTVFYYFGNLNSMFYVETGQAHSDSARHQLNRGVCQLSDRWNDINIHNIYIYMYFCC